MNYKKSILAAAIIIIVISSVLIYRIFSLNSLMDSRRVDGIVEPVYTQDCFPKTLEKNGVSKRCFERANLGQTVFCSKTEIAIIEGYYKIGQGKDPLNGTREFCAD